MGASVWQRNGAAGGGKTFTSGVVASPPARTQQRPGKRKLIWKREHHPDSGDASQAQPDASDGAENGSKRLRGDLSPQKGKQTNAHPAIPTTAEQPSRAHAAAAQRIRQADDLHKPGGAAQPQHPVPGGTRTSSGQPSNTSSTAYIPQNGAQDPAEELRQLKEKIAAREARLQREQAAAKAQAEADKRQKEDMSRRRSRLQASMSEEIEHAAACRESLLTGHDRVLTVQAFKEAREAMAEEAARRGPSMVPGGDDREVARVLRARDDYEVLRLSPGCPLPALKKRYREMAVILHPDKCLAPRATDAFQRLMTAYQNILNLLA